MPKNIVELKRWLFPLRWIGLVLCLAISFAGREASAGQIFLEVSPTTYSINEDITIRLACEYRFGSGTRNESYWTAADVSDLGITVARGDLHWHNDNWDSWNDFVRHLKDFAKPGATYDVLGRCNSGLSSSSVIRSYFRKAKGSIRCMSSPKRKMGSRTI